MDMVRRGLRLPVAIRQQLHLEPPTSIQRQAHMNHFPNHSMLNVSTAIASTSAPSSPAVANGERGFERSNSAPLSPGGDADFSFHARRPSSVVLQNTSLTSQQPPRQQPPRQQPQYDQDPAQITSVAPTNIPLPSISPIRPTQRPETSTTGTFLGGQLSPMPSVEQQPQHTQQHISSPLNAVTPDSPTPTSRNPNRQPPSMPPNPQEPQQYQQHTQIPRLGNASSRMVPSPLRRSTSSAGRGTLRILSRSMSRSVPTRGRYAASTSASLAALPGHPDESFTTHSHVRSSSRPASGAASARGGPPYAIPVGSMRRNPSRPGRSAVRNVQDAKKRRLLMQMEQFEVTGSMTKFKDGKGSCVLM